MDCSLSGSSVHGISQARILESVAISFSKGSSWSRNWTWVSCLAGRFFIAEPPRKLQTMGNLMWISLVLNHLEARLTNLVQAEALWVQFYVQFSSVAQSCPTLFDPMNRSTRGLPVHHQLLEFTQTHVHWVGDAVQPPHPLSSPSPPAPNPSQHQSLFQCQLFTSGGQSIGVSASASFLPMNTQDWSPSEWTGWISLQSKGLSRVFSNTPVQFHVPRMKVSLLAHREWVHGSF